MGEVIVFPVEEEEQETRPMAVRIQCYDVGFDDEPMLRWGVKIDFEVFPLTSSEDEALAMANEIAESICRHTLCKAEVIRECG